MSSNNEKTGLEECKEALERLRLNLETDFNNAQHYNNVTIPDYNNRLATYNKELRDHNNLLRDWESRTGDYSKYKNYGISEDFTIQWGWADWDTNRTCRECANNQHGWGEGRKISGGAWCNGKSGKLLGADHYGDSGNWGWHVGGSRKWWTCKKSQSQKNNETAEYNRKKPTFTLVEPREPSPPASTFNGNDTIINCCGSTVNIVGSEVTDSNINQVNECIGNIEKGMKNINKANKETTNKEITNIKTSNNNEKYVVAGVGVFSSFFMSIIIISIMLLSVLLNN